jgi:predicted RNA-binding Zn-ribbon protein involved in translation (DUF1610 family)
MSDYDCKCRACGHYYNVKADPATWDCPKCGSNGRDAEGNLLPDFKEEGEAE